MKSREEYEREAQKAFPTKVFNTIFKDRVAQVQDFFASGRYQELGSHLVWLVDQDAETNKMELHLIVPQYESNTSIQEAMFGLGYLARRKNLRPLAVFASTENWMVDTKEPIDIPPSEHPDRQECLTITGLTIDKRVNLARFRINRKSDSVTLEEPLCVMCDELDSDATVVPNLLIQFYMGYAEGIKEESLSAN